MRAIVLCPDFLKIIKTLFSPICIIFTNIFLCVFVFLQVFVPLIVLFLTYLVLAYAESNSLGNIIPPLFFTGVLSYFVTCMFVEVFGMAISTILICYIADEEMFPPEDRFCEGALKGAIKKTSQKASDTQVVAVQPKHDAKKVRL